MEKVLYFIYSVRETLLKYHLEKFVLCKLVLFSFTWFRDWNLDYCYWSTKTCSREWAILGTFFPLLFCSHILLYTDIEWSIILAFIYRIDAKIFILLFFLLSMRNASIRTLPPGSKYMLNCSSGACKLFEIYVVLTLFC